MKCLALLRLSCTSIDQQYLACWHINFQSMFKATMPRLSCPLYIRDVILFKDPLYFYDANLLSSCIPIELSVLGSIPYWKCDLRHILDSNVRVEA